MTHHTPNLLWPFPLALLLAATACTTDVVDLPADDPSVGGSGAATSSAGGSGGGGSEALDLTKNVEISECGGFEPRSGSGDSGDYDTPPPYCDAEVLYWSYDAARQELSFNNSRVELNCCGDHGVIVTEQGGTITVTEIDEPEGGAGRCNCMCVFDFAAIAAPVALGSVEVELVRHVTDGGQPNVVWQGTLDLAEGSGFEVVDTTPSYFCEPYDSAPSAS